ncbi:tetratricopeptide repeat protein [Pedobacter gandavensis]|uniref:Tetratricopeptide repeat protein n=1 Tax=Pedobacter gandavensis TaxID=2679963 RepID=A0ABR6F1E4_9SPHI|nr:tetratricopeptide repeat protein [Pedobacter gandavensis]MBB2151344.1 tetratricopeptide repeat protein [Pedobacter gandavensis]
MKSFQSIFRTFLFSGITLFVLSCSPSKSPYEKWTERAKTDMRLLPKYSGVVKSEQYIEIDNRFIEAVTKQFGTKERASYVHSRWGMDYARKGDLKTAMNRLNQAWLLDQKNPEAYHGFGYVLAQLGAFKEAVGQYNEALALAPNDEQMKIEREAIQKKL